MERVIKKDEFGYIACNNIIIYGAKANWIGVEINENEENWTIIEPKYYRFLEDNCIVEIWYNKRGIVLSNGLNKHLPIGYIGDSFNIEQAVEITYKQAMSILNREEDKNLSYNNKDLMSRRVIKNREPIGWEKLDYQLNDRNITVEEMIKNSKANFCSEIGIDYAGDDAVDAMAYVIKTLKQNNNGGDTDYYTLPKDANTLQDLIEHRNMNGSVKDIFKACYRLGIKTEDELRDLNKMAYYSLREIGRITARKDYITIAKELMGSQAIEKE